MAYHWREKALRLLRDSLQPVPTELNEIDWKSGLSCKTERLAQHLSAFSNLSGGGILVYGVNNDGKTFSMEKSEIDKIVQTLGNIANNNLSFPIIIEHDVIEFDDNFLLFIYIPEQQNKPVGLRGKDIYNAYTRSAGQTVKMSRNQIRNAIASSEGVKYEERIVKSDLTDDEVLQLLNYSKFFELLNKSVPSTKDVIINKLESFQFITKSKDALWNITALGAILLAQKLSDFKDLASKGVIIRKYVGTNNRQLLIEQIGTKGYIVDFEELIDSILKLTSTETINTLRENISQYPRVAIREFVANALVHQDFEVSGMYITVEIFSNRLVVTNPGASLNDVNRLIDLPPRSRNESLAQTLFQLGICERRGSGIDRAIEAVEKMYLPAVKFSKGEDFTKVTLFPQKNIKEMTKQDKIDACYQHACLMYEDGKELSNQSLRERFMLDRNKTSVVSRIIADTIESGKIKPANEDISSKKFAIYVPFYG